MTGTNHAVTGALIAVAVKQPAAALPIALLSHFAIDGLPHWKYALQGRARRIVMKADLALSLTLLLLLTLVVSAPAWLVISCGLLGMLPDAMWLPEILSGKPPAVHRTTILGTLRRFHRRVQWSESSSGKYFELLWFISVIGLILIIGN